MRSTTGLTRSSLPDGNSENENFVASTPAVSLKTANDENDQKEERRKERRRIRRKKRTEHLKSSLNEEKKSQEKLLLQEARARLQQRLAEMKNKEELDRLREKNSEKKEFPEKGQLASQAFEILNKDFGVRSEDPVLLGESPETVTDKSLDYPVAPKSAPQFEDQESSDRTIIHQLQSSEKKVINSQQNLLPDGKKRNVRGVGFSEAVIAAEDAKKPEDPQMEKYRKIAMNRIGQYRTEHKEELKSEEKRVLLTQLRQIKQELRSKENKKEINNVTEILLRAMMREHQDSHPPVLVSPPPQSWIKQRFKFFCCNQPPVEAKPIQFFYVIKTSPLYGLVMSILQAAHEQGILKEPVDLKKYNIRLLDNPQTVASDKPHSVNPQRK